MVYSLNLLHVAPGPLEQRLGFINLKNQSPEQVGQITEETQNATRDAIQARANLRLAKKYHRLRSSTQLRLAQAALVEKLYDGTLVAEVNRLTLASGNGRLGLLDGGFVDIGGLTGAFTRTELYDWTPSDLATLFT